MFCSKCGSKIPDDSKFCENCGKETSRNNPGKLLVPVIPVSSQMPVYGNNSKPAQDPAAPVNGSPARSSSLSDVVRARIIKICSIASFVFIVIVMSTLEKRHKDFSFILMFCSEICVFSLIFVSIKKKFSKQFFILFLIGLIAISCVSLLYLI